MELLFFIKHNICQEIVNMKHIEENIKEEKRNFVNEIAKLHAAKFIT